MPLPQIRSQPTEAKRRSERIFLKKRKLAILEKMYGPAGNAYGPVQSDLIKNPLMLE